MTIQRGATTDVTVFADPNQKQGCAGTFAVLFQGVRLRAEIIPHGKKNSADQLKVTVTVDATAALCSREFRSAAARRLAMCRS